MGLLSNADVRHVFFVNPSRDRLVRSERGCVEVWSGRLRQRWQLGAENPQVEPLVDGEQAERADVDPQPHQHELAPPALFRIRRIDPGDVLRRFGGGGSRTRSAARGRLCRGRIRRLTRTFPAVFGAHGRAQRGKNIFAVQVRFGPQARRRALRSILRLRSGGLRRSMTSDDPGLVSGPFRPTVIPP